MESSRVKWSFRNSWDSTNSQKSSFFIQNSIPSVSWVVHKHCHSKSVRILNFYRLCTISRISFALNNSQEQLTSDFRKPSKSLLVKTGADVTVRTGICLDFEHIRHTGIGTKIYRIHSNRDRLGHRRRMKAEAKAKVVASVWGATFIQFLAALAVLPRLIWKKRMNHAILSISILLLWARIKIFLTYDMFWIPPRRLEYCGFDFAQSTSSIYLRIRRTRILWYCPFKDCWQVTCEPSRVRSGRCTVYHQPFSLLLLLVYRTLIKQYTSCKDNM